jgi:hypothetical protein
MEGQTLLMPAAIDSLSCRLSHIASCPFLAKMTPEGLLVMRTIGVIGLLVLIPAGVLLWKKQDEWFGRCSDTPSETSGGLMYGRMHVWVLYIGALHLALWFAL